MRFWPWLFRRRQPRPAEPQKSPYRMAPAKPPPPETHLVLPDPLPPPITRRNPAKTASSWGLLFSILLLLAKLASVIAGTSHVVSPSPDEHQSLTQQVTGLKPSPAINPVTRSVASGP
jgi:hypothetical protein